MNIRLYSLRYVCSTTMFKKIKINSCSFISIEGIHFQIPKTTVLTHRQHKTTLQRPHSRARDDWYGKPAGSQAPTLSVDIQTPVQYLDLIKKRNAEVKNLQEVKQMEKFILQLRTNTPDSIIKEYSLSMSEVYKSMKLAQFKDLKTCFNAALIASVLHLESRVASLLGQGFYTIGPCGEELLSPIGFLLEQHDSRYVMLYAVFLCVTYYRQIKENPINGIKYLCTIFCHAYVNAFLFYIYIYI